MSATITRWSRPPESVVTAQVHVVLDAWHRPQALVLWGAHGPAGDEFPITLRTSLDTPLTHLARQISARPPTQRFDPVVCTGTDGTYLGVVDVDQLLRVLADQVDSLGREQVPTTYVPADLQGRPRSSAT